MAGGVGSAAFDRANAAPKAPKIVGASNPFPRGTSGRPQVNYGGGYVDSGLLPGVQNMPPAARNISGAVFSPTHRNDYKDLAKANPMKAPKVKATAKSPAQAGAQLAVGLLGGSGGLSGGSGSLGATASGTSASSGTDDLLKQAQALVDASLNPQVNAITRQMQAAQNQTNYNVNYLNNQQARAQGDLSALYDRLTGSTSQEAAAQSAANAAAMGNTNDAYRTLLANEANNASAAQARTNNELSRLGIGSVGPAALAQSQADDKFLQGLAGTNQANAAANANLSGQHFQELMTNMLANQNTQGTQAKTQSELTNNKAVADLQQQLTQALAGLSGQKTDLANTRAAKVQQLYTTLYNTALTNELAQQKAGLGAQVDLAKVGAYNARTNATTSKYTDPTSIALMKSQIAKNLASASSTKSGKLSPMTGAINWLGTHASDQQSYDNIMNAFNEVLHQNISPTKNNYGQLILQARKMAPQYGLGQQQEGAIETMLRYLVGLQSG